MTDLLNATGIAEIPAAVLAGQLDLHGAWERVREKAGMPGADGMTISQFGRSAEHGLQNLQVELANGQYRPLPLRMAEIEKKAAGKLRLLLVPTVVDRVAQSAAGVWLGMKWNPAFDRSSYAYRPGMGVHDALRRLAELRDSGFRWVLDADVQNFFDSVDHSLLIRKLCRYFGEKSPVVTWIKQWLRAPVWNGAELLKVTQGVPQGSPLSPILANFYMHEFDVKLRSLKIQFVRYADDFLVLARTPFELEESRAAVENALGSLHLTLSNDKTRTVSFDKHFRFLGAEMQSDKIFLPFEKKKEPRKPVFIAPIMPPAVLRAYQTGHLKASKPLVWTGEAEKRSEKMPLTPTRAQRLFEALAGAERARSLKALRGKEV